MVSLLRALGAPARLVGGARRPLRSRSTTAVSARAPPRPSRTPAQRSVPSAPTADRKPRALQSKVVHTAAAASLALTLNAATPDIPSAIAADTLTISNVYEMELRSAVQSDGEGIPLVQAAPVQIPEAHEVTDAADDGANNALSIMMGGAVGGIGLALAKTRDHANTHGDAAAALLGMALVSMNSKRLSSTKVELPTLSQSKHVSLKDANAKIEEDYIKKISEAHEEIEAADVCMAQLVAELRRAKAFLSKLADDMVKAQARIKAATTTQACTAVELSEAEAALRYYAALDQEAHADVVNEIMTAVNDAMLTGSVPQEATHLVNLLDQDEALRAQICDLEAELEMLMETDGSDCQLDASRYLNIEQELDMLHVVLSALTDDIYNASEAVPGFVSHTTLARRSDAWNLSVYAGSIAKKLRTSHLPMAAALAQAEQTVQDIRSKIEAMTVQVKQLQSMINSCGETAAARRKEIDLLQEQLVKVRAQRAVEEGSSVVIASP